MAWEGYYAIGDGGSEVEIINVARTEAYAARAGLAWFKPVYQSDLLATLLGHAPYDTPANDGAPWYDPDAPESNEFFGFYPLGVDGIESSSRSTDAIESTLDGGIPGRIRNGMKVPVFNGVLIGSSQRGVEYGFRWLNRATAMKPCLPTPLPNFLGHTLHYLSLDPSLDPACGQYAYEVDAIADGGSAAGSAGRLTADGGTPSHTGTLVFDGGTPTQTGTISYSASGPFLTPAAYAPPLISYRRFMRRFKVTNGPKVTAKRTTSDGAAVWNVTMTGTAGIPWEFGDATLILEDAVVNDGSYPYAAGITPGVYEMDGYVHVDVDCAEEVWAPLFDPTCTPVVSPPAVPVITSSCFLQPDNVWRKRAQIPADYIPLWADAVPVISVTAPDTDVDYFRIQIYADLSGTGLPEDNPCSIIGDYQISYIPAEMVLVFDAVAEAVYIVDPSTGRQRRGDSLVATSDGEPFIWPQMSCGYGYIVTFDTLDNDEPNPRVDLSLVPRAS